MAKQITIGLYFIFSYAGKTLPHHQAILQLHFRLKTTEKDAKSTNI